MADSELAFLKGQINDQGSRMNALRARIQQLHSERDELEVTDHHMRTIKRELETEKQRFNKLVKSMREIKAEALKIQDMEVRKKKIEIAQEELQKSEVEARTWSARIQNLEAQLEDMGELHDRASSPSMKALEPPPNDALQQYQPIQNQMEYRVGRDQDYTSSQSDVKYSEDEHGHVPPKPKRQSVYRTPPSKKQMQDFMRVLRSIPGFENKRKFQQDIEEVTRALKQKYNWEPNIQMQALMEMLQRTTVNGLR